MQANVEIPSKDRPIHGGLVEAYTNYYEDEIREEFDRAPGDYDSFVKRRVREIILQHTPKQRLEVYLEWNGIMGYTETVFSLSRGDVYAREW